MDGRARLIGRSVRNARLGIVAVARPFFHRSRSRSLAMPGGSKAPADSLVFARWDGEPRHPDGLTREWSETMKQIDFSTVTLHSVRHTHASALIVAGLDVLTVSRRLGHGGPAITLTVYGHLFADGDDRAAQIMETAFSVTGVES